MSLASLLYLIFFLSGASALVFESLWFFQAGLALGNSIWASSLVLASFMAGLAAGNAWVSLRGDGIERPVRLYAVLELVIALTGTAIVFALPRLTPWLAPWLSPLLGEPVLLNSLRASVGFALMLIPAVAMGATLPLLVSALSRHKKSFGQALGGLYGWNTLGAVGGVLIAELFLVEHLGIRGTALVAGACNCTAALLSLFVDRSLATGPKASPTPARGESAEPRARARLILATAFGLGALLLGLEVIWFRFLILFVAGTPYTFAVMLAVVLGGIGCGGLLASAWLKASDEAWRSIPLLCLLAGGLCLWLYLGFGFYSSASSGGEAADFLRVVSLAFPLMFPVALLSGLLFTLLGERLHVELGGETRSAGLLTLANTVGAALGSLIAGFILLPRLGMETSLFVLALGYGLAAGGAVLAGIRPRAARGTWAAGACLAAFGMTAVAFPHGEPGRRFLEEAIRAHAPRAEIVDTREGLTETIVFARTDVFGQPRFYRLITNSHSMSATTLAAQRYMKLFVYLPVALHEAPRKALLISYGVGATARGLVDTEELETIDMVDISSDILEMSRSFVSQGRESLDDIVTDSPLDDPRTRIHVEDGRFFLQTTEQRFDIITGEPPPPKLAGIVNLYTQEYFQLIHDRLARNGIATYWLPVHSLLETDSKAILRAFCEVFEDCSLWTGAGSDWIMMGSRERTAAAGVDRFVKQWNNPLVGPEMVALGIEKPGQIGALFMADARQIQDLTTGIEPLTDDFPRRLSTEVGSSDYSAWTKIDSTRARFLASDGLDTILPAEIREESLAFFPAQRLINTRFGLVEEHASTRSRWKLVQVHALMEDLGLRTLPLWLLEGDYDFVRAARKAARARPGNPMIPYELGIWSLTQQDWAQAEEHLGRAARLGRASGYLTLRAYVLCRGGKLEEGRRMIREFGPGGRDAEAQRVSELLSKLCQMPPSEAVPPG